MPSHEEPKGDFKRTWKHCLNETIKKSKERLENAQTRCEKNYDARLHKKQEVIHDDDYVFIRVEPKNPKDHRHKLASIAEGLFKVTNVDGNMITIEETDRSVEIVSRSRVVLATTTKTEKEVRKISQPVKLSTET